MSPSPNHFEFRYTPADVASAQRMRFLRSNQLKFILLVWAATAILTAGPLIIPGIFPVVFASNWGVVLEVMLVYTVTLGVLIFVTPFVEYFLNRFWRLPLTLQFNDYQMRVHITGKPGGMRLKWSEIQRTQENQRVFILFYGAGGKFFILPRSAFKSDPAAEEHFRGLLNGGGKSTAAADEIEDELDEVDA